jgi:deazaflavin-dependent oxidoreductase (nitroreductase family)
MFIAGRLRKWILYAAGTRLGLRVFYVFVHLIDLPVSRLTHGAFTPSAVGNVMPIFTLITLGARTNQPRVSPVLCLAEDGKFILVGSNWGNHRNPAWVYNLRAHPRARICKGKMKKAVCARELQDAERQACWQRAVAFYPLYRSYESRSGRTLPVFLLEP